MDRYHETMARLLVAGMRADNLPLGFQGGAKMRTLNGVRMKCTKATLFAHMEGDAILMMLSDDGERGDQSSS